MGFAVCAIIGFFIGGVFAWFWASSKAQASLSGELREAQSRAAAAEASAAELKGASGRAAAAEASAAELRAHSQKLDADLRDVRSALSRAEQAQAKAEAQLVDSLRAIDEQKRLLADAQARLTDTFKALSNDALKSNNQAFMDLAKKTFETITTDAKGDLGKRQEAIAGLVKPLQETLKRYEEQIKGMEEGRQKAYGTLEERLKAMSQAEDQLRREAGNLVTALRSPKVRGRWGEVQLRRLVELTGMSELCDYTEQVSVNTEDGRLRPDMIVRLPGGREVVVDAKVPLEAYLQAVEAGSEEARSEALRRHASQVREHMNKLSRKEYWSQFPQAPDLVVMFIPGECFFSAALECDATLLEDGFEKRVGIATPTTLFALLRAIDYGWRQEKLAESAREISALGEELYRRLSIFSGRLATIGERLEATVKAYNESVGSLESRVLPCARKFEGMGVDIDQRIGEVSQVETTPRRPQIAGGENKS
ncbi:MAG TPA: DNA recombination protein RmuC [Candidatus Brocadiia bacterium]|nr:DNA recombination protein RmuC [Candidatus Brocadiia bacterium]